MKNITGGTGIWLYGADEGKGPFGYMDISYNYVQMNSEAEALAVGGNYLNPDMGPVDAYRNTFVGKVNYYAIRPTMGSIKNHRNVVVNSDTNGVTCNDCDNTNPLVVRDNLTGNASSGIIDSNGKLTSGFTSYLGTTGWQFSNQ